MFQSRRRFCFVAKTFQMGRTRPVAEADNFYRDRSIKTFLTRAINNALSAAANFLQQFVIAEIHLHSFGLRRCIILLIE